MQKTRMLETANFRVPWPDWPHPFFTMSSQKFFDQLLIFVNLYQHAKNQFIPSVHSQIQPILKSHNMTGHTHFWTSQPPKTFKLIFMKLYQYAKNKLIPLVDSILESSDQIAHINMQHSLNSKNPIFSPFPQFLGQKKFFHEIELLCTTS